MRLTQSIDYAAISPLLAITGAAIAVLVLDLFAGPRRRAVAAVLSLVGTAVSLGLAAWLASGSTRRTFCFANGGCSYVVNNFTAFFQVLVLAVVLAVVLLSTSMFERQRVPPGEYHALLLMSASGMVALAAARDLLTLLVALEVVSLPAFVLVGLRRGDSRGGEAALKFFLFSVVSTALTLYGMSLVYGVTGSLELGHISRTLAAVHSAGGAKSSLAAAAVVLVIVGFAFKVSAVPFHFWAPDTYQGAPVPVAAFLSVASKAAGLAGLVILLFDGFRPYAEIWGPVIGALAAASMTVGNVVALRQWNIVRLLAWSTVAQAGYLLVPLGVAASAGGRNTHVLNEAFAATLTYIAIYAAMNLGAFAVIAVIARQLPNGRISDYRGLVFRSPWLAIALALFLTALAGLPPGVAGLFAKVVVLRAAVHGHATWLAIIAAVNTVIGLAYYLRVAALLFASSGEETEKSRRSLTPATAAVAVAAAVTVVFSVYPQPLLHAASTALP
jgi:NADH-quinone oxidoreductase subunit N